jgi:formate hydrogenlyase subunit 3/multisubunit Na+/H+ antiporter MnhD subunit
MAGVPLFPMFYLKALLFRTVFKEFKFITIILGVLLVSVVLQSVRYIKASLKQTSLCVGQHQKNNSFTKSFVASLLILVGGVVVVMFM